MYRHFTKISLAGLSLLLGLAIVLLGSPALAKNVKITTVDCSDPEQTLAGALSTIPLHFVNEIRFTGTCYEELDFNTSYVTIKGDDDTATIEGHVWIAGADNVILDGFDLVVDDGDTGVEASMGASVRITDVTIDGGDPEGEETVGIFVLRGSVAHIANAHVTMLGEDAEALQARDGGMVRLGGGNNLTGGPDGGGVAVTDHATLIQGGGHDVFVGEFEITGMSYARVRNVSIEGDVHISRHSGLRLRDDSSAIVPTVDGDVVIGQDSYARLEGRSRGRTVDITGDVVCFDTESSLELRGEVNVGGEIDCTDFNQPELPE